jgi:ketosteroid isomerase-like protein
MATRIFVVIAPDSTRKVMLPADLDGGREGIDDEGGASVSIGGNEMAHPNEDLVRDGFAAFARGDLSALQSRIFAPDIRWHFPGRNPYAGHHEGVAEVAQLLSSLSVLSGGTHRIELHHVLVNDEHVVALHTTRAERPGRQLEVEVVQVFRVSDGRIAEAWTHHSDLYAFDEFWA